MDAKVTVTKFMTKMPYISAGITLASFLYKFTLGIITPSVILVVASISTLIVFVCKVIFCKFMDKDQDKQRVAYFVMMVLALAFALLFFMFSILKVGGIDITHENKYEGFLGYAFIFFVIVMFVLSIINLRGALNKKNLMVIGLKEVIFMSALTDAVIIEEFLYRCVLKYTVPFMNLLNAIFPVAVAIVMLSIPFFMFKRYYGMKKES